jgi:hypothetical protein
MKRFWNKKTPVVTIVLAAVVDVTSFVAVTEGSPLGYWPPVILLAAIMFTVLNNLRLDRSSAREVETNKDSPT